jgi:hypothetical protein
MKIELTEKQAYALAYFLDSAKKPIDERIAKNDDKETIDLYKAVKSAIQSFDRQVMSEMRAKDN